MHDEKFVMKTSFRKKSTLDGVTKYLVQAGPRLVEQSSGFNVFWNQFAPHSRDLRPAVEDLQRQVLVGLHRLVWDRHTHTHTL